PHWRLLAVGDEKDTYVQHTLARALQHHPDWQYLHEYLSKGLGLTDHAARQDVLFLALVNQYDLDAVRVLGTLAQDREPVLRKKAVSLLGRVWFDRKPYA